MTDQNAQSGERLVAAASKLPGNSLIVLLLVWLFGGGLGFGGGTLSTSRGGDETRESIQLLKAVLVGKLDVIAERLDRSASDLAALKDWQACHEARDSAHLLESGKLAGEIMDVQRRIERLEKEGPK